MAWVWVFTALAAAMANVMVVAVKRYVLHRFTWVGRDFVWMSPVANLLALLAPATILLACAAFFDGVWTRRAAAVVLGTLSAMGIVLLLPGLSKLALVLLAVGGGVQFARLLESRPDLQLRRMRWASAGMAVTLASAALVARSLRYTTESMAADAPPPADDAPNVLLIIFDTARASDMSLFGYARQTTPVLERLAGESVTFDRAISTAPWTLPAHCSIFTGLYPRQTSCRWTKALDAKPTTLAEVLAGRGYRTGGFVGNLFYTTWETGLHRGFSHWDGFTVSAKQIIGSAALTQTPIVRDLLWRRTRRERLQSLRTFALRGDPKPENDRKSAGTVSAEFLRWLDRGDCTRPFFAFLNYFDAHDPFEAPPPYDTRFARTPMSRDEYDGAIAYMDAQVGVVLAELKRRGVLDRTIVVIAADHGEQFGEHNLQGHGNSLYLPLLHVPLMIRYPGTVPAGKRVPQTVSLRDVPATVLDLAHVDQRPRIPGASLAATWRPGNASRTSPALAQVEQGPAWWPDAPARRGSMQSIIDDSLHYMSVSTGEQALYAYRTDPGEENDLLALSRGSTGGERYRLVLSSRRLGAQK